VNFLDSDVLIDIQRLTPDACLGSFRWTGLLRPIASWHLNSYLGTGCQLALDLLTSILPPKH